MDENYEISASGYNKKRGRPRKADTVLLPGEISALGLVTPTSDAKSRKPRLPNSDVSQSGDANRTLIGQSIHGVVDGSFDAGYLVTVRLGDSDTVFRGVVFGPGLSIPLSKAIDVAPKVKSANRGDAMHISSPASLSPIAAPSPTAGPSPTATPPALTDNCICPTINAVLPAVAGSSVVMQPMPEQMANHEQQHFMYGTQDFTTPVQGFHLSGSEFSSGGGHFGAGGQCPGG